MEHDVPEAGGVWGRGWSRSCPSRGCWGLLPDTPREAGEQAGAGRVLSGTPSQGGTAEEQQEVVAGSSLEMGVRRRNLIPVIPETLGGFPYLEVLKV